LTVFEPRVPDSSLFSLEARRGSMNASFQKSIEDLGAGQWEEAGETNEPVALGRDSG
jgi:hypothetical protein